MDVQPVPFSRIWRPLPFNSREPSNKPISLGASKRMGGSARLTAFDSRPLRERV